MPVSRTDVPADGVDDDDEAVLLITSYPDNEGVLLVALETEEVERV